MNFGGPLFAYIGSNSTPGCEAQGVAVAGLKEANSDSYSMSVESSSSE
mgnify:CR=1 FL=1